MCRLFGEVQLRFARDGSTPIRDQLATQLMLAIASGELGPGKRLPSTRALAKRFRVNANTVSAAYRQLELLGWVDSVRGSGVYVRMHERSPAFEMESLDRVTVPFLRALRAAGFSADAIRNRIDYWLAKRPKRFVFVHPEAELQAIIVHELKQEMSSEVEACDAEPAKITEYVGDSIFLTVPSKERVIRGLLPAASELLTLQFRHVDDALAQYLPIRPETLLVIASAWPSFLQIARTMLMAAGCDPDAIVFCDTRVEGWRRSLEPASAVVCDVVASESIPDKVSKIVFNLVSDGCIARLKSVERFFID